MLEEHGSRLAVEGIWVPGVAAPEPLSVPLGPLARPVDAGAPLLQGEALRVERRRNHLDGSSESATALVAQPLTVTGGRATALVGPSGGGKSTWLAALAGLVTPVSGRVTTAEGREVGELPATEIAPLLGWVPQWSSSALLARTGGEGRLFYRRRADNSGRKAGNIADWVRAFGGAYENMVVLDADSTMAGETLLRMVDAMERNPGVGLIQTAPTIIKARTIFARVSQYSVRLYGRVAAAGLAYWTGSESSYWGHNAIIRTRAFAACCGLPELPGKPPFGGHVLSHDFVEAALMRRNGWGVHIAPRLPGSYEEGPPSLPDSDKRDRRWCQGNLQYWPFIKMPGLKPVSRFQLFFAMLMFLASPAWIGMLVFGAIDAAFSPTTAGFMHFGAGHALLVLTFVMWFAPHFATEIDVLRRPVAPEPSLADRLPKRLTRGSRNSLPSGHDPARSPHDQL